MAGISRENEWSGDIRVSMGVRRTIPKTRDAQRRTPRGYEATEPQAHYMPFYVLYAESEKGKKGEKCVENLYQQ
ncbi:hypothetical protein KTH_50890 [Thermosporothrix hazakensis]|nr:hypothetical protein KTH_50890 [Thermosporothrix hazakensis]